MRALWSIVVVAFALFALASPSLAVFVRSGATIDASVAAAADPGTQADIGSNCVQGGARVLPCQPDLGVLIATLAGNAPSSPVRYAVRHELPARSVEPGMNLPPPRSA